MNRGPRGFPFALAFGVAWLLTVLLSMLASGRPTDPLLLSSVAVLLVGLAVAARRWWRRAGGLWPPVLVSMGAAFLGPFAVLLLLVPSVRTAIRVPPSLPEAGADAEPWWRRFMVWDVRQARSLALPLAITNVAFVALWFAAALVVAALVIGSPTTSYEHGYHATVLYLAGAAAITSALVTLAWLDRRHVCRAYERSGGPSWRTTAPIALGAVLLIGAEVVVSYGQYVTLFGAPNPPTRRMVAYAHPFEEYAIESVGANGTGVERRLVRRGPVSEPVESPDGTQVAFMSTRGGSGQIYVVGADGCNERQLTHGPRFNIDPAWSPDGRRIAFSSARDGNPEIYVMNADGSGQRRLTTDGSSDENPSWSPDGKRITFTSDRDGNSEIYVVRSEGGGETRITNDPADDLWSAWSPDASTLAFTSDRDGDDEIYLVRLRDRALTQVTRNRVDDSWPTWSPDGRRLAFVSDRGGVDDIWVTSLADGVAVNYTKDDGDAYDEVPSWSRTGRITFARETEMYTDLRWRQPTRDAVEVIAVDEAANAAWSPDGERIAFSSNASGEITLADADLTYTQELPGNGWDWAPDWSPDGDRLAFVSDRTGRDQIYTMDDEGGKQRRLTHRGSNQDPAWSPDGRAIAFASDRTGSWRLFAMRTDGTRQRRLAFNGGAVQPAWSPDGRRLAFAGDRRGTSEIYVADADGTHARRVTTAPIGYDDASPTWSPDGRLIAFERSGDDGSDSVFLVSARGGKLTRFGELSEPVSDPDWQPPRRG